MAFCVALEMCATWSPLTDSNTCEHSNLVRKMAWSRRHERTAGDTCMFRVSYAFMSSIFLCVLCCNIRTLGSMFRVVPKSGGLVPPDESLQCPFSVRPWRSQFSRSKGLGCCKLSRVYKLQALRGWSVCYLSLEYGV